MYRHTKFHDSSLHNSLENSVLVEAQTTAAALTLFSLLLQGMAMTNKCSCPHGMQSTVRQKRYRSIALPFSFPSPSLPLSLLSAGNFNVQLLGICLLCKPNGSKSLRTHTQLYIKNLIRVPCIIIKRVRERERARGRRRLKRVRKSN